MARKTTEEIRQELARIEVLVRSHPEGISLRGILDEFALTTHHGLPERTMIRRLGTLVTENRIRSDGQTSAARYFATPKFPLGENAGTTPPPTLEAAGTATGTATAKAEAEEGYVPLSPEAEAVRALVKRPIVMRPPVGYREKFLRNYRPGKTWYLPKRARAQLHERGRTPDANQPAGTFAHEIFERLLIDLAWASSALEGNTYTRLDTKNLLEYGVRAEGKAATDAQMILNHKKAIEFLVDQAEDIGFNRYTFFNLHAALSENLLGDPQYEGRLRTRTVGVTGTTYVPLSIPAKIEELFDLILEKANAIPDPFEQAFFLMVHLPYLQPFDDVNKRTSRLAANISLIKANLCPLSFVGLPNQAYVDGTLAVYEFNRIELLRDVFVLAYERSCDQYRVVRESLGEPDPIRLRYRRELGDVIRAVVLAGMPPVLGELRNWASTHQVPEGDQERFAQTALELLLALHEGSSSRYGLRRSEFENWRLRLKPAAE
jgi:Fic/DOC family